MLPIFIGNPNHGKPSSYTRFILPFAYQPVKAKKLNNKGPYFNHMELDDLYHRRKYFTPETSRFLFDDACWLQVWDWDDTMGNFTFQDCPVGMSRPWIVLFNWDRAIQRKKKDAPDTLCTGMLVVELYFRTEREAGAAGSKDPPTLKTLLDLNELYRYWQRPYPGHEVRYAHHLASLPLEPFREDKSDLDPVCRDGKPNAEQIASKGRRIRDEYAPNEPPASIGDVTKPPSNGDIPDSNDTSRDDRENDARSVADLKPIKDEYAFTGSPPVPDDSLLNIYLHRWAGLLYLPVYANGQMWHLIPEEWRNQATLTIRGGFVDPNREGCTSWMVYPDDRTFVWTCAITQNGGNDLRSLTLHEHLPPEAFTGWVQLLNVDRPSELDTLSKPFERRWARERTYQRWADSGSFYGFNLHAGVMLAPAWNEPPLWKIFGQMYCDQALLLLYLRTTLFRFSKAASDVSRQARAGSLMMDEEWRESFHRLHRDFMLFTNQCQFPLISNQQQGVEMYALARKHMDVDGLFTETQAKLAASHQYAHWLGEGEKSGRLETLTWIATFTIALTLTLDLLAVGPLWDAVHQIFFGKLGAPIKPTGTQNALSTLILVAGVFLVMLVVLYYLFSNPHLKVKLRSLRKLLIRRKHP